MSRFSNFYLVLLIFNIVMFISSEAHAGVCAKVSMQVLQKATTERVAFDAKLILSNGMPDTALENIRVDISIKDSDGTEKGQLFYIRPPQLTAISAVDGTGILPAVQQGEAHWLIIPAPGAGILTQNGVVTQNGVDYLVGATLNYSINGTQKSEPLIPATITVNPMPQLVLDYFMPYQVIGDNPFTPLVEPPVPYPLALRVMNDGYGTAIKLRIDSAQPKIVESKHGLLVDFKLLGATVNDAPATPSFTVNFGDLPSKKGATASWQMISTLSGRFEEFKTSFTHASELGGTLTSLITATNPHYLTHMVKVNLRGRDSRLDFLAYDTDLTNPDKPNPDKLPQYILESEIPDGSTDITKAQAPVTVVLPPTPPVRPTPETPNVPLDLPTGAPGWIYTKMTDPSQGLLKLIDVIRSDGVHLDPHNFWVDQGLDTDYKKIWTLQFVDYRAPDTTPGGYTLTFTQPDVDTTPPSTTLIFDGPASGTNPVYITPQTRLVLTATDNDGGSGVEGMYKKVAGQDADFVPAYPFNLTTPGIYTVQYYSADLAGNVETTKNTAVTVVAAAPAVSSFTATPTSFAPQAPKGIAAARTVDFSLSATSGVASLPVEIAISSGTTFQVDKVVRTLKGTATSGAALHLSWDGKDSGGKFLPVGSYTAQVKVSDGLDNAADANAPLHNTTATTPVAIADWFKASPVDPNPDADQLHAKASGTKVVWQDQRSGHGEIYLKDLANGTALKIGSGSADQLYPAIDGNVVVWQDNRSGNWDIYGYDLGTQSEFPISISAGDQTQPVIAGSWVAWQDNRNGNGDIYAYNLTTPETLQITNHERDQINPTISGTTVTWEDYRHGFGEIYQYDLSTRAERQASSGPADETLPAASGATLVWSDKRNNQKDIYTADPARGALRVTYGAGDHSQPAVLGDLLVYTDYESGADDPNLSFRVLASGIGGRLSDDPAHQEEPALGSGYVLWQDNRTVGETNPDRHFQIYAAPFATETTVIEAQLKPGFNLVAVGSSLATPYPSASALIAAKGGELGTMRLLSHDPLHNTYTEAIAGEGDFNLAKGTGLVIYAQKAGNLQLAESGETATYTLLPGANQIGILTVPFGYSSYDLMNSLGLDNIQSVRRFDNTTGAWQTAAVRQGANGAEIAGMNFIINSGDGLMITMKNRVDGWTP